MQVAKLGLPENLTHESQAMMGEVFATMIELQLGHLVEILLDLMRRENIYHALPTEPSAFEHFLRDQIINRNLECLLMIQDVNLLMSQIHWNFGLAL
jgi:hypothetical protein